LVVPTNLVLSAILADEFRHSPMPHPATINPQPPRRLAIFFAWIVPLLLTGALTSWLVAAFAVWPRNPLLRSTIRSVDIDLDGNGYSDITRYSAIGLREHSLMLLPRPLESQPLDEAGVDATWLKLRPLVFGGLTRSLTLDQLLQFADTPAIYVRDGPSAASGVLYKRIDAGWPFSAFRYEEFVHNVSVESSHLLIHFTNSERGRAPLKLPIQPIWYGFALNAVIYGLVWATILLAPPAVIRFACERRRRQSIAQALAPPAATQAATSPPVPNAAIPPPPL
jgi:hypothetical protein